MKVLLLANNDGGLYRFRRELLERLLLEHEVHVSCPKGTFFEELVSMGCIVHLCEMDGHGMNPAAEWRLYRWLRKLIREIRPDMVFTYTIKPNIYGGIACGKAGIPYAANITGLGLAVTASGWKGVLFRRLYKAGLKKARIVFFQNAKDRTFMLQNGIVNGKNELLPGSGVNLSQFNVLDYPEAESIEFLFLSRVMKQKGIEELLTAAKAIREKYPNTVFHICGTCDKEYEEKIKQADDAGIVAYHGFVKNTMDYQRISSCTVHPTYYPEGMSNVVLESCACGRPVITTDRPGCKEAVDDGVTGFLVKERDSADLTEKLERFLMMDLDDRRRMGLAARRKVEAEFDREIVVRRYLELLSSLTAIDATAAKE